MSRIRLPPAKQTKLVTYYKYLFRENSFYDSETLKLLSGLFNLSTLGGYRLISIFNYRAVTSRDHHAHLQESSEEYHYNGGISAGKRRYHVEVFAAGDLYAGRLRDEGRDSWELHVFHR